MGISAGMQPLAAQTVNVNAPGSLTTATGTTTPANGAIWNLNSSGIFLDTTVTLPVGELTINGNGNTLTLNNAGAFGAFENATASAVSLSLSDLTISGGSVTGRGGAISNPNGGALTLNTTGAVAFTNNSAVLNGGAIFSTGGGISIGNANSIITLTDNHSGFGGAIDAGFGALTIDGSVITLSGNTGVSSGGAIYSNSGEVSIGSAGSTVVLTDNAAAGFGGAIYAGSGPVTLSGSAVTLTNNTSGGAAGAIFTIGAVTLNASAITVTGNRAAVGGGGAILAGGNVSIVNASNTVMLSGNTAAATGDGGAILGFTDVTVNGSAITLTGNSAGGHGGAVFAGGDVTLNAVNGDITFSGNTQGTAGTPRANAIYLNNNAGGATMTLNAAAGSAITFFDPIQSNAPTGLVSVAATGPGTVAFDGSLYSDLLDRWSQVYGTTTVEGGIFAVRNDAVYGVLAADVGQTEPTSFTVDSGATLAGGIIGTVRADNFALNGTLNIAGAAVPGTASGGFSTFNVVSSNVSFGAGSQVLFNTYLNDASVQRSDLLVLNLNGSAVSGTAGVRVTNVGGGGGLTIGNGIELVQVVNNNGTTAGAFTLNGRVAAGAFEYELFHGSVDASGPQNWYLRSTLMEPGEPGTPPEVEVPNFRPEVPVDTAVPALASRFGLAMLGTFDDRTGGIEVEPALVPAQPVCEYPNYPTNAYPTKAPRCLPTKAPLYAVQNYRLWGRLFGETGKVDQGGATVVDRVGNFERRGPSYDFGLSGLQAGIDLYRGTRDIAGLYVGGGYVTSNVQAVLGGKAGNVTMDAFSAGGYWTHKDPAGWYTDTVLQGTRYDDIHAHSVLGETLSTAGWGFVASFEGGYRIGLGNLGLGDFGLGDGWAIIPQAQVLYQTIGLDDGADHFGLIHFGDAEAVYGRIGARLSKDWVMSNGQTITTWARANLWHTFDGTAETTFSNLEGLNGTTLPTSLGGTWTQLGLGISGQVARNVSVFAHADYNINVAQGNARSVDGRVGVKYAW